jgi:hypothetical protein
MDAELSEFKRKMSTDFAHKQDMHITVGHRERNATRTSPQRSNFDSSGHHDSALLTQHGHADRVDVQSGSGSELDQSGDHRRHRDSQSSEEGEGIKVRVCLCVCVYIYTYVTGGIVILRVRRREKASR